MRAWAPRGVDAGPAAAPPSAADGSEEDGPPPAAAPARPRGARRALAASAASLGAAAALGACAVAARGGARGAARGAARGGTALFEEEAGPLVNTPAGLLRGTLREGVACFLGVPFGRPPVRFAAPEPAEPWGGVRDTTRTPPRCHTHHDNVSSRDTSEDCLFLNVCTLADSLVGGGKLQPVVVHFHGGAFRAGACGGHGNDVFPRLTGGVYVCPSYRLGVLGFFSTSAAAPLALGLLDQQLALRWVQQTARAFGGDPERVLITGQSAGGASVVGHLVMPSSAGLFTSASIMSPGGHPGWKAGPAAAGGVDDWVASEDLLRSSAELARRLGCRGPADLGCLRAVAAEEVVEAAEGHQMRFAPSLPGNQFPLGLIRKGRRSGEQNGARASADALPSLPPSLGLVRRPRRCNSKKGRLHTYEL
ncbi:unnamed protein product [Prorocentrum cordatum]|uniref:Carboxylic ester hydrolase n=1 Tax=Prorocentrum cordatum TaxID=2364126 RepID=A0ABN9UE54_9DINO|nr:unnamed protein product [Polarella glacialis]